MQHRFLRILEDVPLGTGIGWRDRSCGQMSLRNASLNDFVLFIARLLGGIPILDCWGLLRKQQPHWDCTEKDWQWGD